MESVIALVKLDFDFLTLALTTTMGLEHYLKALCVFIIACCVLVFFSGGMSRGWRIVSIVTGLVAVLVMPVYIVQWTLQNKEADYLSQDTLSQVRSAMVLGCDEELKPLVVELQTRGMIRAVVYSKYGERLEQCHERQNLKKLLGISESVAVQDRDAVYREAYAALVAYYQGRSRWMRCALAIPRFWRRWCCTG